MRKRGARGIALITALFFVLVIGMVAHVILAVGPSNLQMAEQALEDMLVRRACEAGMAYARSRLDENTNWKGDGNALVVDTADMQVLEDNGNVFGLVRGRDGQVSLFRIRFNYQDGTGGLDGLSDPAINHFINNVYVSYNNLATNSTVTLPVADPTSYVVTNASIAANNLTTSGASACLQVEGRVGPGLQSIARADDVPPLGGNYLTRTIRFGLVRGVSAAYGNSPLMAGGNIYAETGPVTMPPGGGMNVSVSGITTEPRIRTKKGIKIVDTTGAAANYLNMNRGIIGRDPASGLTAVQSQVDQVIDEYVGDNRDFLNKKWSSLTLASTDPNKAVQLKAGTYVAWPDGSCHYYDSTFANYKANIANTQVNVTTTGITANVTVFPAPANPGVVLSPTWAEARADNLSGAGLSTGNVVVNLTAANPYFPGTNTIVVLGLNITKDVNVIPSASGVKDLCVMSVDGRALYSADSQYLIPRTDANTTSTINGTSVVAYYGQSTVSVKNVTVSGAGEMLWLIDVLADDSTIISEGNLVIGSSAVQVNRGSVSTNFYTNAAALSLYTKKNLIMSTFTPTAGGPVYTDLHLEGLLYAWGNITLYGDEPSAGSANATTKFQLDGSMIAYGADPMTQLPGSNGGNVNIYCHYANLVLDASKLGASNLMQSGTQANLVRSFYAINVR